MKTKYCLSCKTAKNETSDNFQRRGDTFRSPCKACMKKIKDRKKPKIQTTNVSIQEEKDVNKVTIEMADNDLMDELVASLLIRFGCHFSLSISRDGKARLAIHGNPTMIYRAESAADVINDALQE